VNARLLALPLCAAVLCAAGCGGDGTDANPAVGSPTAPTNAEGDDEVSPGDPRAGEIIFVTEGCGGCHSLEDAGVIGSIDEEGSIGPDLDQANASYEELVEVVTNGRGAMPAFEGDISPQDIQDVAAYVTEVAGK
jgi:mono/diheme cytochrome c family protein